MFWYTTNVPQSCKVPQEVDVIAGSTPPDRDGGESAIDDPMTKRKQVRDNVSTILRGEYSAGRRIIWKHPE